MAVKEKLPTENLYNVDIIDTLKKNGGSISDWSDIFTSSANINGDSKHKPVILNDEICQDISKSITGYKAKWWQADDGFCGWSPGALLNKSYSSSISLYDGARNGWSYQPPYGKSYLRQNDFAGYYPAARPMFSGISAPSEISLEDTSFDVSISVPSDDGSSLNITDFDVLSNYLLLYCFIIQQQITH